ncbi:MAG TPA: hypothetical protein VI636_03525 [Candidatus Angelobacter sp.]
MNPEQSVVRKRRTQTEIEQLVTEFLGSGMKEVAFCRSRGLSWDTLNRHLQKQGHKREGMRLGSRLVRVKVVGKKGLDGGQRERTGLTVVVGSGRRVEIGVGFDAATLEQVVAVLEGM